MLRKLFIHASNVHQGGGKLLLTSILRALPSQVESVLSLDIRMPVEGTMAQNLPIRTVAPTILSRFLSELWLAKNVRVGDTVLCFGNLPPMFRVRGKAVVFVQNRYLVESLGLAGFPFKTRFRLFAERCWLHWRITNADVLIVQTPTMKKSLELLSRGRVPIRIMPFTAESATYFKPEVRPVQHVEKEIDFLYVASGEPHKNHRRLIEAWCLLARDGIFPALKLTLDSNNFVELCAWITEQTNQYGIRVTNAEVPHEQMSDLYSKVSALIYPSTMESFGLPLIEARQAGVAIVASELDYVRDVADPAETFDPHSAMSIARAVKRFLGIDRSPLLLRDAGEFIKGVLETSSVSEPLG